MYEPSVVERPPPSIARGRRHPERGLPPAHAGEEASTIINTYYNTREQAAAALERYNLLPKRKDGKERAKLEVRHVSTLKNPKEPAARTVRHDVFKGNDENKAPRELMAKFVLAFATITGDPHSHRVRKNEKEFRAKRKEFYEILQEHKPRVTARGFRVKGTIAENMRSIVAARSAMMEAATPLLKKNQRGVYVKSESGSKRYAIQRDLVPKIRVERAHDDEDGNEREKRWVSEDDEDDDYGDDGTREYDGDASAYANTEILVEDTGNDLVVEYGTHVVHGKHYNKNVNKSLGGRKAAGALLFANMVGKVSGAGQFRGTFSESLSGIIDPSTGTITIFTLPIFIFYCVVVLTCLWNCYSVIWKFIMLQRRIYSALNGANGEHTGLDDVNSDIGIGLDELVGWLHRNDLGSPWIAMIPSRRSAGVGGLYNAEVLIFLKTILGVMISDNMMAAHSVQMMDSDHWLRIRLRGARFWFEMAITRAREFPTPGTPLWEAWAGDAFTRFQERAGIDRLTWPLIKLAICSHGGEFLSVVQNTGRPRKLSLDDVEFDYLDRRLPADRSTGPEEIDTGAICDIFEPGPVALATPVITPVPAEPREIEPVFVRPRMSDQEFLRRQMDATLNELLAVAWERHSPYSTDDEEAWLEWEEGDFYYEDVEAASQLNGSHGEYTEGDDLADHERERVRNARAKSTAEHQKKVNGGRNPEYIPPSKNLGAWPTLGQIDSDDGSNTSRANRRVQAKAKAKAQKLAKADQSDLEYDENGKLVVRLTKYVVVEKGQEFGNTGTFWTTRFGSDGLMVDKNGMSYLDAKPGDKFDNVVSHGPGYITVTNDVTKGEMGVVARPCIYYQDIPAHKQLGCRSSYWYYIKLFEDLRRQLPGRITDRLSETAIAISEKYYDVLAPPGLVKDTVDCFLALKSMTELNGYGSDHIARLIGCRYNIYSDLDQEQLGVYAEHGIEDVCDGPWVENGESCVDMDYDMKVDFNITFKGNVLYEADYVGLNKKLLFPDIDADTTDVDKARWVAERYGVPMSNGEGASIYLPACHGPEALNPRFGDTTPNAIPKYKLTNFFRVLGERRFLIYDVNAQNCNVALKRLIGCRKHEWFYYQQQFSLLGNMYLRYYSDSFLHRGHNRMLEILEAIRVCPTHHGKVFSFDVGAYGRKKNGQWPEDAFGVPLGHSVYVDCHNCSDPSTALANQLYPSIKHPWSTQKLHRRIFDFVAAANERLVRDCVYDKLYDKVVTKGLDSAKTVAHQWKYYTGYQQFLTFMSPVLSREFNADIPHLKRALRRAYVRGVLLHDNDDIMVKRLNACVKKELAKAGKAPRLFVSYDAGCMYANELPEWTKVLLDGDPDTLEGLCKDGVPTTHTITYGRLTCTIYIMAKPKSAVLDKCLRTLITSLDIPNHLFVLIYSDDSCYAGCITSKRFGFNVDISSCDSSQGPYIFGTIGLMLTQLHKERGIGLLKQCTLPIKLEHPSDKDSSMKICKHGPMEGSGTVLTTILNHVASYNIAHAVLAVMGENFDLLAEADVNYDSLLSECILAGAAVAGHLVTTESCRVGGDIVVEKFQFLKRSPILTTSGDYVASTNLGCVLRSLGSVEGNPDASHVGVSVDVFTRMSDREFMDKFVAGVVGGLVHEASSPIIEALRQRFPVDTHGDASTCGAPKLALNRNEDIENGDHSDVVLDLESLCRRYDCTPLEMRSAASCIGKLNVGRIYSSDLVTKIYKIDYGL